MRIFGPLISAAAAATVTIAAATTGLASGGYKIEFSFNCNNPSVCFAFAGALGGDWGSIRLNSDGTGTAEFTSAVHSTPAQPTGAVHYALVLTWSTFSSATPPTATVAPDPNGNYLMITVVNQSQLGSLLTPATPGRYSFNGARLGAPGLVYMINVGSS
jgi:hypothetical protein